MRRLAVLVLLLLVAPAVRALDEIDLDTTTSELLATPPRPAEATVPERRWAVLPELGYAPDTGPVLGAKFTDRDLAGTDSTLDVEGLFSVKGLEDVHLAVASPHIADDQFLFLFNAAYLNDPQRDFFGLGNNDVGPDALSTHRFERAEAFAAAAWHPAPRLALQLGVGVRHVHVGRGDRSGATPFTVDAFPGLPGVGGGYGLPIEGSLILNTRDGIVRPTRGWRAIAKVSHTPAVFGSDFHFTRMLADVGYLFPFHDGAQVLGLRANGAFIDGHTHAVPFWEYEELGGDDTLQGYFPRRFLGTARILANAEYRARVAAFSFFDIWYVQMDAALFAGAGRVFVDRDDPGARYAPADAERIRVAGGPGLRIALSQAIVARIDVGFSNEETAIAYLAFGQSF